ncbi:MAG: trypsin-like peptidase domain-containing protein [Planctomycetota bacterium]
MMRPVVTVLCAAMLFGTAGLVGGQADVDQRSGMAPVTVEFDSGRRVTAPILKETAESVWLDLGFEVLAVPRSQIASIERSESSQYVTTFERSGLYAVSEGPLPERSPQEWAKILGPAVIKVSTPAGLGSGFVTDPDGYAVTNAHVIQGETEITATVFLDSDSGIRRVVIEDVKIVAVNNHIDLALIKLEHPDDEPFVAASVMGGSALQTGEEVFAIGNPLGLERTLSAGVVATTNRNFEGLAFVQTTAEINPGNSGGPLFNLKGEVVGCTNMGALFADGIGFAIPARYIRDFLDHHDAFSYGKDNPNSGYTYGRAPQRKRAGVAPQLDDQ